MSKRVPNRFDRMTSEEDQRLIKLRNQVRQIVRQAGYSQLVSDFAVAMLVIDLAGEPVAAGPEELCPGWALSK